MAAVVEVVATLDELVETANREHQLVMQAGGAMVEHAIRAGEALLSARDTIGDGDWGQWLADSFVASAATAHNYMRLAIHQEAVRGLTSMRRALSEIAGQAGLTRGRRHVYAVEVVAEARALYEEGAGINEIAREFGTSNDTVLKWVDPDYHERRKVSQRASAKVRRDEEARARAKRAQAKLKRLVRERGGGIAEAYSLACRMEDELGRASREASSPEAKRALSNATGHFHKMRDEIVRALGAS